MWVKIDDHFDEHPKLMKLGPIGWGVWLASLAYCNRNLTDGFIPREKAESIGGRWRLHVGGRVLQLMTSDGKNIDELTTDEVIESMVESGVWTKTDGGYKIHDYEQYQPSKETVLAKRKAGADRLARHRDKTRNMKRVSNGVTGQMQFSSGMTPANVGSLTAGDPCNGVTNALETPVFRSLPDPDPENLETHTGTPPSNAGVTVLQVDDADQTDECESTKTSLFCTRDAALEAIADASGGCFVKSAPTKGAMFKLDKLRKRPDVLDICRKVGEWLKNGGDWRTGKGQRLDGRNLGDIDAWVAQAEVASSGGSGQSMQAVHKPLMPTWRLRPDER